MPILAVLVSGSTPSRAAAEPPECHAAVPPTLGLAAQPGPLAAGGQVLYVNAEGAELVDGNFDDAPNNQTVWSDRAGDFPPYGDPVEADIVIGVVADLLAPYDVVVTGTRPASGPYTMLMLGPGPGSGGFATLDCGDINPNNIGFIYSSSGQGHPHSTGVLVAHEAGHTFGLDHVDDETKVMNPIVYEGNQVTDTCLPFAAEGVCGKEHLKYCESGQNSHAELLATFGPTEPDTEPPTISIVSPVPGGRTGSTFFVQAALDDSGSGLSTVWLSLDGEQLLSEAAGSSPQWEITGVGAGPHFVTVRASDLLDNVAAATVDFTVVVDPIDGGGGSDGGGSDGGGSDGGGSDDGGLGSSGEGPTTTGGGTGGVGDGGTSAASTTDQTGNDALPGTGGQGAQDGWSGCQLGGGSGRVAGWSGLLMLFGLVRRRKAAGSHW